MDDPYSVQITGGQQDGLYDLLDVTSLHFDILTHHFSQIRRFEFHHNVDIVEALRIWREEDCVNFRDLTFFSPLKFTNG